MFVIFKQAHNNKVGKMRKIEKMYRNYKFLIWIKNDF